MANFIEAGVVAAITTGDLTVTIPTHVTNDIIVVTTMAWLPNSAAAISAATAPTGWTRIVQQVLNNATPSARGHIDLYWKRATSASETFVQTRPASPAWDTGTDGLWAGRAHVYRNCVTSGDFYNAVATTTGTAANGSFPVVTVGAAQTFVTQFWICSDNTTITSQPTGWFVQGAGSTTATGTDAGFSSWEGQTLFDSNSPGTATTNGAPANSATPGWVYAGLSFKNIPVRTPPPPFMINRNAIRRAVNW